MGLLSAISPRSWFGKRAAPLEDPRYSVISKEFIAAAWATGAETSSGETVTLEKALAIAALWQVVSKIAQSIACLPIEVYRRDGEEKKVDREDPASIILRKQFSDDMTAYDGRLALNMHALLGNGYAFVGRNADGQPLELIPIDCRVDVKDGRKHFFTKSTQTGEEREIPAADVVHIQGPSWDGFVGADVLWYARDILGQYLSAQKYTGRFFKNGAQSGGIFEIPANMSRAAQQRLAETLDAKYSNPDNWFRALKLFDGVKWQGTSFDPQKAQLIEQKNAFAVDVCRFFNMSPAMIGVEGYTSYNSLYEARAQFLDDCLAPRLMAERIAYEAKLLRREDWLNDKKFIEHNTKALLRMSPIDRAQVYASGINAGWMSPNEARAAENMPPREGGDEFAALPVANNSGGANKTPANPNDPGEPGEETLALQGQETAAAKADRARLIIGMINHGQSKIGKPRAFRQLVDGGMATHREFAKKSGLSDVFDAVLADFNAILQRFSEDELASGFDEIAKKWGEEAVK